MISTLLVLAAILILISVYQYMKCYTWCMGKYPHLKGDNLQIRWQLDDFVCETRTPTHIKTAYRAHLITFVCATISCSAAVIFSGKPGGYFFVAVSSGLALYIGVKVQKLK